MVATMTERTRWQRWTSVVMMVLAVHVVIETKWPKVYVFICMNKKHRFNKKRKKKKEKYLLNVCINGSHNLLIFWYLIFILINNFSTGYKVELKDNIVLLHKDMYCKQKLKILVIEWIVISLNATWCNFSIFVENCIH